MPRLLLPPEFAVQSLPSKNWLNKMNPRNIAETILAGKYCIGCGGCAATAPDLYKVGMNADGCYQSSRLPAETVDPAAERRALAVCPFSPESRNEDSIAEELFPSFPAHPRIGRHLRCAAGKITDRKLYGKSSSGGISRWVLSQLLASGRVDAVIHVQDVPGAKTGEPLFRYGVSSSLEEIENSSRSAYYPVEMSGVLDYVRRNPGRYAITGVPCFIKALRNLSTEEPLFKERILYTVGIVCGHLKSKFYAEMLGWQLGVLPENLSGFDFRVKIPGRKANEKGVSATDRTASGTKTSPKTVQQLFGTNYGQGYFKYNACDYCDDVLAETADIAVGDAWLPEFLHEGTSIIVVRNPEIAALIEEGERAGSLQLAEVTPDAVAKSQDAGLRHRREGLAYRLHLKKRRNEWAPVKRVSPTPDLLTHRQKQIQKMRLVVARSSFHFFRKALSSSKWETFHNPMLRVNFRYHLANVGTLRGLGGLVFRSLKKLLRKIISSRS
jgi:coenzyme F420-reducing hydrogenase beta subunit